MTVIKSCFRKGCGTAVFGGIAFAVRLADDEGVPPPEKGHRVMR
jgi:hypothetical protein